VQFPPCWEPLIEGCLYHGVVVDLLSSYDLSGGVLRYTRFVDLVWQFLLITVNRCSHQSTENKVDGSFAAALSIILKDGHRRPPPRGGIDCGPRLCKAELCT